MGGALERSAGHRILPGRLGELGAAERLRVFDVCKEEGRLLLPLFPWLWRRRRCDDLVPRLGEVRVARELWQAARRLQVLGDDVNAEDEVPGGAEGANPLLGLCFDVALHPVVDSLDLVQVAEELVEEVRVVPAVAQDTGHAAVSPLQPPRALVDLCGQVRLAVLVIQIVERNARAFRPEFARALVLDSPAVDLTDEVAAFARAVRVTAPDAGDLALPIEVAVDAGVKSLLVRLIRLLLRVEVLHCSQAFDALSQLAELMKRVCTIPPDLISLELERVQLRVDVLVRVAKVDMAVRDGRRLPKRAWRWLDLRLLSVVVAQLICCRHGSVIRLGSTVHARALLSLLSERRPPPRRAEMRV